MCNLVELGHLKIFGKTWFKVMPQTNRDGNNLLFTTHLKRKYCKSYSDSKLENISKLL